MDRIYQSPLEHHCHVVRTVSEMLVVPLHYLAILDLHLVASWVSAATLVAYALATYGLHMRSVAVPATLPPLMDSIQ
jgi:hypothetical protein